MTKKAGPSAGSAKLKSRPQRSQRLARRRKPAERLALAAARTAAPQPGLEAAGTVEVGDRGAVPYNASLVAYISYCNVCIASWKSNHDPRPPDGRLAESMSARAAASRSIWRWSRPWKPPSARASCSPGDQLPPQRAVADQLGHRLHHRDPRLRRRPSARAWSRGASGRGTFVRRRAADDEAGLVDLSMNLPPPPQGVSLATLLKETTRRDPGAHRRGDPDGLSRGPRRAGPAGRRRGAGWRRALGEIEPERIVVCPGAESALTAILATIAKPGDGIVVEPLTYPGSSPWPTDWGCAWSPAPVDDEGFLPEALARLCADERPAAVYLVPTNRNPVAPTMGLARRRDDRGRRRRRPGLADRGRSLRPAVRQPPARLAALAPERDASRRHPVQDPVARPAHRLPGRAAAVPWLARIADALRATALMGSP